MVVATISVLYLYREDGKSYAADLITPQKPQNSKVKLIWRANWKAIAGIVLRSILLL